MTSYWDNWIDKINSGNVTKMELIELINKLHRYDHENKEILSHKVQKR